jgi:hypothetical protein
MKHFHARYSLTPNEKTRRFLIFEENRMMEKDNAKVILGLLAGAAAGLIAGYLLAGGNKDELIGSVRSAAGEIKDEIERIPAQGEALMDETDKESRQSG